MSWLQDSEYFSEDKTVCLWIHTHVRGTLCGFSSVDVHTQFAYSMINSNVLGLVLQLDQGGFCQKYDFYDLTEHGQNVVSHCGRTKNTSSIQHESCSGPELFQSASQKVSLDDEISIIVHDFRVEDLTISNESLNWNKCKNCTKEFKNILLHLSKSSSCKASYGKQFEEMKKAKETKKKEYSKAYYAANIERIKKRKREHEHMNKETIQAKRRKYNHENKDARNLKHKIYCEKNRMKINETQKIYDEDHHDENIAYQREYNKTNRKAYILRNISIYIMSNLFNIGFICSYIFSNLFP